MKRKFLILCIGFVFLLLLFGIVKVNLNNNGKNYFEDKLVIKKFSNESHEVVIYKDGTEIGIVELKISGISTKVEKSFRQEFNKNSDIYLNAESMNNIYQGSTLTYGIIFDDEIDYIKVQPNDVKVIESDEIVINGMRYFYIVTESDIDGFLRIYNSKAK